MPRDVSYHKAAIQYNDELADFAEDLANRLEHEEVARWSRAVVKQHRFHSKCHNDALTQLEAPKEETSPEKDSVGDAHTDPDPVYGNLTPDATQAAEPVENKEA